MPHVTIQLAEGRTDEQKHEVARLVTKALNEVCGAKEGNVSVSFVDYTLEQWRAEVTPHIIEVKDTVYKWPVYLERPDDLPKAK